MPNFYNASQSALIDQDNRNMAANGIPMSQALNDLHADIDTGNIGIQSSAPDVDSIALGGGAFSRDKDTGPGTSLVFAWLAGRVGNGLTITTVGAGNLTLAASTINYVQWTPGVGVVSNTSGFTAGSTPLYVVTTSSGSYTDAQVVSAKALLQNVYPVEGAMLSQAAATKEIAAQLGASISAATSFLIPSPAYPAVVEAIAFANSTSFATSNTDYWTFAVVNLGPSGTGTTAVLNTGPINTTKATGGSSLSLGVARSLALNATSGNLITAANDVLQLTLTPTGSPAPLTLAALRLDFSFAD